MTTVFFFLCGGEGGGRCATFLFLKKMINAVYKYISIKFRDLLQ